MTYGSDRCWRLVLMMTCMMVTGISDMCLWCHVLVMCSSDMRGGDRC